MVGIYTDRYRKGKRKPESVIGIERDMRITRLPSFAPSGLVDCLDPHPGARFAHPRLSLFGPSGAIPAAECQPREGRADSSPGWAKRARGISAPALSSPGRAAECVQVPGVCG